MRPFFFSDPILPSKPGGYIVVNGQNEPIYVGQTANLAERIGDHRGDRFHCMHRHGPVAIWFEEIANQAQRLRREAELILQYAPPCNR